MQVVGQVELTSRTSTLAKKQKMPGHLKQAQRARCLLLHSAILQVKGCVPSWRSDVSSKQDFLWRIMPQFKRKTVGA